MLAALLAGNGCTDLTHLQPSTTRLPCDGFLIPLVILWRKLVRTNVKMLAAVAASALGLLGLTASPAMASVAAPSCESGASAVRHQLRRRLPDQGSS